MVHKKMPGSSIGRQVGQLQAIVHSHFVRYKHGVQFRQTDADICFLAILKVEMIYSATIFTCYFQFSVLQNELHTDKWFLVK